MATHGTGSAPIGALARPLLRAFHARRPLRAGSLLITLFGDAVAPRGGEIALGSMIELARPFGLSERLVRTSMARLAQEGWLVAMRVGRLSYYRLTAHGRAEFASATQRIYGSSGSDWSGVWTLALTSELGAGEREAIARTLRWRGFGQALPGMLVYPGDCLAQIERELAAHSARPPLLTLLGRGSSPAADHQLAMRAWDLAELEKRYRKFMRLFEPVSRSARRAAISAESSFVVRTLLIHEYRRVHLRDPLLPAGLLPRTWTGTAAAELCRRLYVQVFRGAEQFLSSLATNSGGSLPPPDPESLRRFGGLPR